MAIVIGSIVAFAAFIAGTVVWGLRRFSNASSPRGIATGSVIELGRVDVDAARRVQALRDSVTELNERRMRKDSTRGDLAGVVVFGPRQLTWAPDDRTRSWGVTPWQIPWSEIASVAVAQPDPNDLTRTRVVLATGDEFEIRGLDAERVRTGLRRHHPSAEVG